MFLHFSCVSMQGCNLQSNANSFVDGRHGETSFDSVSPEFFFPFIPVWWETLRAHFVSVCVCISLEGELAVFQQQLSNKVLKKIFYNSTVSNGDAGRGKRNTTAGPSSTSNNWRIAFPNSQGPDSSVFQQFSRIHLSSSRQTWRSLNVSITRVCTFNFRRGYSYFEPVQWPLADFVFFQIKIWLWKLRQPQSRAVFSTSFFLSGKYSVFQTFQSQLFSTRGASSHSVFV